MAIASHADGTALVLAPTAAFVWARLVEWTGPAELVAALAERHPEVTSAQLRTTVDQILAVLDRADVLERSA